MLESGSRGHSVLQTPALVVQMLYNFYICYSTLDNVYSKLNCKSFTLNTMITLNIGIEGMSKQCRPRPFAAECSI